MLAGDVVIWRSDLAGGSDFKMVHVHGWRIGAGCWQETSAPRLVDLPRGLLECPPDRAAAFPREKDPRENKMEAAVSFVT